MKRLISRSRTYGNVVKQMIIISAALVCILTGADYSFAARPILLDDTFNEKIIGKDVELLEDAGGKLTIHEVSAPSAGDFRPSHQDFPNLGYTSSVFWVRFQVHNPSARSREWILEYAPPWTDHVDVYIPGDKGFRLVKSGESMAFHERRIAYKNFAFRLDAKPGTTAYFMRLNAGGSTLNIRLMAYTPDAFRVMMNSENICLFMYFGLMTGMLIFNLFIAFSVRNRGYFYYVMFVASFLLYILVFEGTAYQYLWPSSPWWAGKSLIVFLLISTFTAILFTRNFLRTQDYIPAGDKLLRAEAYLCIPGMILSLFPNTPWMDPVAVTIGVFSSITLLLSGIVVYFKGYRPARFYLIAFSFLLSGVIFTSFRAMGIISDNFFTIWGFETGSSMTVILLSFALADRINITRKSLIQAHRELVELNRSLIEEREKLAVTLRSIGDGVITIDLSGNVVLMNGVMETLTGWQQHETIGGHVGSVLNLAHENSGIRSRDLLNSILGCDTAASQRKVRLISRSNEEHLISCGSAPIKSRDGEVLGTVLVIRDITEQRKLEDDIIKASKLESLGLLAGGIAHDFNNILTVILGSLAIAKMNIGNPEKAYRHLTKAEDYSCQAKNLTQQLLTFSRGGEPIKSPMNIKKLLIETSSFVMSGSNVKIEFALAEEPLMIEADEGQISQVFNNLIINAIQAMPDGGVINVTGAKIDIERDSKFNLPEGHYIKITINDQGSGIAPENHQKIFDPYFTTKEKGTGLGLTSAYSIVKKHHGHIGVESSVGIGSNFVVILPALTDCRPECSADKNVIPRGRGRILIMDDEDSILEVVGLLLAELGYESSSAHNGNETLELYRKAFESGNPFDAVIIDLTIPGGTGGRVTIRMLKDYDNGVRAIVSSGYSNDPIMANFRDYGFCGMVIKPYRIEALAEALRTALGEKADMPAS